jgi:hypothetical protein
MHREMEKDSICYNTCKVKSSEEWPTQVDRLPLNKSMRHVVDSDSIDSMM